MVAVLRQSDTEIVEQNELVVLERILGALCEHLTTIVNDSSSGEAFASREAQLQLEAFEERRDRALRFLAEEGNEPMTLRIGNLEKLLEALECSWLYFNELLAVTDATGSLSNWSIRVS